MTGNRFDNQPFNVGGGGFDGFGGGGILGGILLASLLGRRGGGLFGNDGCGDGGANILADAVASKVVTEQNTANLREQVAAVNTTVEALGNELQAALAQQTLGQTQEFRNLDNQICAAEKAAMTANFEARIAALQSTNEIKSDINALSVETDAQTCEILKAINADGDATRALINLNTVNSLRDELAAERRRSDSREVEINVTQTNQQTQAQMQAQFQAQNAFFANAINPLFEQIAKQNQGIVNLGTMVGNAQTAANTNVKA